MLWLNICQRMNKMHRIHSAPALDAVLKTTDPLKRVRACVQAGLVRNCLLEIMVTAAK